MTRALKQAAHAAIGSLFGGAAAERVAFYHFHGHLPDLRNPRTFSEKIIWRKFYDRNPSLQAFADKARAKELAVKLIGRRHVISTLGLYDCADDVPLDWASPVVVKATHGSGMNIFLRGQVDRSEVRAALRGFLRRDYSAVANEWAYSFAPRLLVEPLIERTTDFKFHVFGGKTFMIQVDVDRFTDHRRSFYTPDWTETDCSLIYPRAAPIPRPATIEAMIAAAEKIGGQFSYARVDLYEGPLFGEVTFYPEAGRGCFSPASWDERFGQQWDHGTRSD